MAENTGPGKDLNIQQNKPRKRTSGFLVFIIIVLALAIGSLTFVYLQERKETEELTQYKVELEHQKEELEEELKDMYVQYDSMKTENDSINKLLAAEQEKIEELLKIQANNIYKIRLYKEELGTLREIMRSYIVQIDSLNTANQQLRTENLEVKTQLKVMEKTTKELEEERSDLSTKVEQASVLQAKNIVADGLNRRSREKDRVNRIEKLRVCFTLRENAIIEPGTKEVFMRIMRPDSVILTSGVNLFEYQGEPMVYTASREVDYENQDVDICIYWDDDGQLIEGTYSVDLFAEGNLIGSSSFLLR